MANGSQIRSELETFAHKLGVPAVAGGVLTRDGQLKFDVVGATQRDGEIPVEPDDQWHIGSCAKSITAVLYARLVERGDADWHAPVLTLFPDLKGEADPGWSARTIEELLLCQAGMQANLDRAAMEKGWLDTRPLTEQRSDAVRRAMQPAPKRAGKFLYSNLGYMVIGAAIDRITGTSFEDALEHYVLRPLGITTLGYGAPPKIWGHSSRWRFRNVVLGRGKAMDPTDARSDNPAVMSSAGTLHVTMADWAKFLHLFITNGGDLLSKETIEHLLTAPAGSRMSKGWASADRLPGVSHGVQGSNTMWAAAALLNKPRDRASLVACNDGRTRIVSQTAVLAMRLLKQA